MLYYGHQQIAEKGKAVMKAVVIKTTKDKSVVEFEHSTCYETLKTAVGGWIERVSLGDTELWVNEEGKLTGLDINPTATALWADMYGLTDVVMGDVIITGGSDDEGETLGLKDELVEYFLNYNKEVLFI